MFVVNSAVIYKHITVYYSTAFNPYNKQLYYIIFFSGSIAYPISIYYYNKNDFQIAVYLHMLLHILANVANIILYSGQNIENYL